MSSPTQPLHRISYSAVARLIIVANNSHFGALNMLFVSPLMFFLVSFPWYLQTMILSESNKYKSIAFSFIYTLILFSLSIVSIATVTYSTHQGSYGRPLTLIATIKSLSSSFFPLASTISLISICIIAPFALIFYTGFKIDFNYPVNFMGGFTLIIIVGLFLLFSVYIMLASVLAVLESKWGLEPLRDSYYIIKRMKLNGLSLLLLNGFVIWLVVMLGLKSNDLYFITREREWSLEWSLSLVNLATVSLVGAVFTVQFVAAITVSTFELCRDCRLAMDAPHSKVKDKYLAQSA